MSVRAFMCVRVDIHHSVYCVSRSLSLRPRDYISVYGADKSAPSTSLVFSHALPFRAGRFPSSSRVIMSGFDVRHPRSLPDSLTLSVFDIYSLSYSILDTLRKKIKMSKMAKTRADTMSLSL